MDGSWSSTVTQRTGWDTSWPLIAWQSCMAQGFYCMDSARSQPLYVCGRALKQKSVKEMRGRRCMHCFSFFSQSRALVGRGTGRVCNNLGIFWGQCSALPEYVFTHPWYTVTVDGRLLQ
jgi:hypothetical protein